MDLPLLIAVACVSVITLITSYVCFYRIFLSHRVKETEEYPIPEGDIYEVFRDQMINWIKEGREKAHTDVCITSFDGLKLRGKFYEYKKGAPIEILFHGYKGTAERDLSGGIYRCACLEHSALIVDHRASGNSEGRVITFGEKERRDCVSWINFVIENIDKDAQIIIAGVSMGAATVLMAASMDLPRNVIGVLADCSYTSTKDIVKKVMSDMKLPADILYPFARLGAILFGKFDPDAHSPVSSMKKCKLPVIFYHGDIDDFVPCYMSEQSYNACTSEKKKLVIIKNAGHGLCFPVDVDTYIKEAYEFFNSPTQE